MTKYLCTLFDSNYLHLGITLCESVSKHFDSFFIWILALDSECLNTLRKLKLPNAAILSLEDIDSPELQAARSNRTWQEFCWTLSPVLPSYIMSAYREPDHICYLDADICFFSSPEPIYAEIADHSIMIIPHRFPERLKHLEVNGIFNVQMVYFRRDETGLACLSRWKEQCIEWCFYKAEDGKLGDQKYLDEWPMLYGKQLRILECIQAGVALWNVEQYRVSLNHNTIMINNLPLIFYHFHQFKYFAGGIFTDGLKNYSIAWRQVAPIYETYIKNLRSAVKNHELSLPRINYRIIPHLLANRLLKARKTYLIIVLKFFEIIGSLIKLPRKLLSIFITAC